MLQVIHQLLKQPQRPQSVKNNPGDSDLTCWRGFISLPTICISDLVRPPLGLLCLPLSVVVFKWTLDSVALVGPLVMIQTAPVMSPASPQTHKSLQSGSSNILINRVGLSVKIYFTHYRPLFSSTITTSIFQHHVASYLAQRNSALETFMLVVRGFVCYRCGDKRCLLVYRAKLTIFISNHKQTFTVPVIVNL